MPRRPPPHTGHRPRESDSRGPIRRSDREERCVPRPTTRAAVGLVPEVVSVVPKVVLVVLGAALLLGACAVGPSQRPPVATRVDDTMTAGARPGDRAARAGAVPAPPAAARARGARRVHRLHLRDPELDGRRRPRRAGPALRVPERARRRRPRRGLVARRGRGAAGDGRAPCRRAGRSRSRWSATPAGRPAPSGPCGSRRPRPPRCSRAPRSTGWTCAGTGNSEPVDCITPSTREALVDADPLAADPVSLAPLREAATTAARTCTQVLENALTDYRTGVDAEDLEEVRITLGVDRLHVVGVGDGAGVLATWARRYPASVGRTVLDGVADPTTTFSQRARERAAAAREALTAFASDCSARPDCPLGPDPASVVTGILTNVRAAPLTGADGRRVTDGTVTRALVTGLARAGAVARARDRDRGGGPGRPGGDPRPARPARGRRRRLRRRRAADLQRHRGAPDARPGRQETPNGPAPPTRSSARTSPTTPCCAGRGRCPPRRPRWAPRPARRRWSSAPAATR